MAKRTSKRKTATADTIPSDQKPARRMPNWKRKAIARKAAKLKWQGVSQEPRSV